MISRNLTDSAIIHMEDDDIEFFDYLTKKIRTLADSSNVYMHCVWSFIHNHNFEVKVISGDRTDYRGEATPEFFTLHKTKYETYDSLCWLFFHELGHLILMNTAFEGVFKGAKATYYKDKGFEGVDGIYWVHDDYYDYYQEHHDEDPEEKIVSMFATFVIGENYDRSWWYNNIELIEQKEGKVDNGQNS